MTGTAAAIDTNGVADVGLVGLAVMGQNLVLNMADHGFQVAVFNRTAAVTERFVADHPPGSFGPAGGAVIPTVDLAQFVAAIRRPRRIILLVKAGGATDAVIDAVAPLLDRGDLLVDGGNALFTDTARREKALAARGILFVGSGVSGGEEGARFGPSLMPGGTREAWTLLEPVWMAIAAKVDAVTGKPIAGAAPGKPAQGGVPCATYIGPDGAGHYVKMVHNGIEYADMQLIGEAYHLLRTSLGKSPRALADVFARWNTGALDSFLVEITAEILRQDDPATGRPFVDVVLDAAGQKGTGKWTSVSALELGVPAASITEAVFARFMSALKDERVRAAGILPAPDAAAAKIPIEIDEDAVGDALYCSKLCVYAQGFQLLAQASREMGWNLELGAIAQIFRGGCIIRARFLQQITEAFARAPDLENLMLDPVFAEVLAQSQMRWRRVVARAALEGIPVPAMASALSYLDGYRTATLPANLLQAQRDFFGAHTYERVDAPRGERFHIDWLDPRRPQIPAAQLGMNR